MSTPAYYNGLADQYADAAPAETRERIEAAMAALTRMLADGDPDTLDALGDAAHGIRDEVLR